MSDGQQKLIELLKIYKEDPIKFVRDVLKMTLSSQQEDLFLKAVAPDARVACKSATGTGKTTTLACLIFQQLITEGNVNILATAPSAGQLERGLRSELGKVHAGMAEPFKSFFVLQRDKVFVDGKVDTHFCALVTGSVENKENLAGFHADKVLILIDEASSVMQDAYDTLVGNLTTAGSSLIQISNPVRPTGPFFNLFSNDALGAFWHLITLDALSSPFVSDQWIEMIKAEYGESSDFYRMRVLGKFPRAANSQFIDTDMVNQAVSHNVPHTEFLRYPIVLGVDVARFGDDSTVLFLRQGPKVLDIVEHKGLDNMEVAAEVVEYCSYKNPDKVFIDGSGLGSGVVDRLNQIKRDFPGQFRTPMVDVVVGSKSSDPKAYSNLRSQVWGSMKTWVSNGADIPNNQNFVDQLTSMQYGYNSRMQVQLMVKKDMKKLGLSSPDIADACSLTFAEEVYEKPSASRPRKIRKANVLWC